LLATDDDQESIAFGRREALRRRHELLEECRANLGSLALDDPRGANILPTEWLVESSHRWTHLDPGEWLEQP
jgi:hypothetical protein